MERSHDLKDKSDTNQGQDNLEMPPADDTNQGQHSLGFVPADDTNQGQGNLEIPPADDTNQGQGNLEIPPADDTNQGQDNLEIPPADDTNQGQDNLEIPPADDTNQGQGNLEIPPADDTNQGQDNLEIPPADDTNQGQGNLEIPPADDTNQGQDNLEIPPADDTNQGQDNLEIPPADDTNQGQGNLEIPPADDTNQGQDNLEIPPADDTNQGQDNLEIQPADDTNQGQGNLEIPPADDTNQGQDNLEIPPADDTNQGQDNLEIQPADDTNQGQGNLEIPPADDTNQGQDNLEIPPADDTNQGQGNLEIPPADDTNQGQGNLEIPPADDTNQGQGNLEIPPADDTNQGQGNLEIPPADDTNQGQDNLEIPPADDTNQGQDNLDMNQGQRSDASNDTSVPNRVPDDDIEYVDNDIPPQYWNTSLECLYPSTTEHLSLMLDIPDKTGECKDCLGLAERIGIEPIFIRYISEVERASPKCYKTQSVLQKWESMEDAEHPDGKVPPKTIGQLRRFLLRDVGDGGINRPDVVTNTSDKLVKDAESWEQSRRGALAEQLSVEDKSWQLTRHDVVLGKKAFYSTCLCYANEDEWMATLIQELYTSVYPGVKFFHPQFDLKRGKYVEDTTAQVIKERCKGNVIFILSEYFFACNVCAFTVNYTRAINQGDDGNMVPFHLTDKTDHVPNVLKGIAGIRWYKKAARAHSWEMLTECLLNGEQEHVLERVKDDIRSKITVDSSKWCADPQYTADTPPPGNPVEVDDPPVPPRSDPTETLSEDSNLPTGPKSSKVARSITSKLHSVRSAIAKFFSSKVHRNSSSGNGISEGPSLVEPLITQSEHSTQDDTLQENDNMAANSQQQDNVANNQVSEVDKLVIDSSRTVILNTDNSTNTLAKPLITQIEHSKQEDTLQENDNTAANSQQQDNVAHNQMCEVLQEQVD